MTDARMVSVDISPMSSSSAEDIDLVRGLYAVLKNDCSWHFLWEGSYLALRFDPTWLQSVEAILRQANKKVTPPVTYEDNIPITRKYQEHFEKIFHEMSVLAVEMFDREDSPMEFIHVADRITHCYFNMCRSESRVDSMNIMGLEGADRAAAFEPLAMSLLSHLRSYIIGRIVQGSKVSHD